MGRSRRQAGHTGANIVVLGYLLAAAVDVGLRWPDTLPTWLLIHLLLLGAATNAIITWSAHFASAMLQQPPLPPAATSARLVALNAGIVGVLVCVSEDCSAATAVSASLVAAVVLAHLATLARTAHRGRARRFVNTIRFYWAACAAVVLGIGAGLTVAIGRVSPLWWERVYVTHVHLGLLGWIGLTVLGTEFTLWPTALRTRMSPRLERAARWSLLACSAGLAALSAGLLSWVRPVALAGLLLYLLGVLAFLDPFLRTAARKRPREPATAMLFASTCWLGAGLVVDAVHLVADADVFAFAGSVAALTPWLLVGFAVQVLLGALSYLVPVLLGGAPSVGRRTAAALNRHAVARVLVLNAGAALLAVPGASAARAGWLLVAASIVAFAALTASAVLTRRRAGVAA